jgi:hypothetical protein
MNPKWQRTIERLKRMPLKWKLLFGGQFIVTMYMVSTRLDQMTLAAKKREMAEEIGLAKRQIEETQKAER